MSLGSLPRRCYAAIVLGVVVSLSGCGKEDSKVSSAGEHARVPRTEEYRPAAPQRAHPLAGGDFSIGERGPAPTVAPWAGETDGVLTAAGIEFDVPEGWTAQTPTSRMRLAQYELPGDDGPAVLTIFCFGVGSGGSVQANIDRWLSQLKDPHEPQAKPTGDVMTMERNGLKLSIVKAIGTYSPDSMAQAESVPSSSRLYGLIVEGGAQGNVFVKITGPARTVEAQGGAIAQFVGSARGGE